MKCSVIMTTIAVVVGSSLPAHAQNSNIRFGTANSTPYMAQRFQAPPMPQYMRQFGVMAGKRYYLPYGNQIASGAARFGYNMVRRGGAVGMALGNPATAWSPGVGSSTPPWMKNGTSTPPAIFRYRPPL
jgi:hypothetical protein